MSKRTKINSIIFENDPISIIELKPNFNTLSQIKKIEIKTKSPLSTTFPQNLTFYDSNHLIIVDNDLNQVYKINLNGNFVHFFGDSNKPEFFIKYPNSAFVSKDDRVFITESGYIKVKLFNGSTGLPITSQKFKADQFESPFDVSIDSNDRIYISDPENEVIQIFDSSFQFITVIPDENDEDLFCFFDYVKSIKHNSEDYLYACNDTGQLFVYDRNLQFCFNFGQWGTDDHQFGSGTPKYFSIDKYDRLVITDTKNNRLNFRNSDGSLITNFTLKEPTAISYDPNTSAIVTLNESTKDITLINPSY